MPDFALVPSPLAAIAILAAIGRRASLPDPIVTFVVVLSGTDVDAPVVRRFQSHLDARRLSADRRRRAASRPRRALHRWRDRPIGTSTSGAPSTLSRGAADDP